MVCAACPCELVCVFRSQSRFQECHTPAHPGPGGQAVPFMCCLDLDGLGGLQPTLYLGKPQLQDSNCSAGHGLAGGDSFPAWFGALCGSSAPAGLGLSWGCCGCGSRALSSLGPCSGHSWAGTDNFSSCCPVLVFLCSPPRSQTPQDSHRALEIESHSSGEKNSFQVRAWPRWGEGPACAWAVTGETCTAHSNPGRSRLPVFVPDTWACFGLAFAIRD